MVLFAFAGFLLLLKMRFSLEESTENKVYFSDFTFRTTFCRFECWAGKIIYPTFICLFIVLFIGLCTTCIVVQSKIKIREIDMC